MQSGEAVDLRIVAGAGGRTGQTTLKAAPCMSLALSLPEPKPILKRRKQRLFVTAVLLLSTETGVLKRGGETCAEEDQEVTDTHCKLRWERVLYWIATLLSLFLWLMLDSFAFKLRAMSVLLMTNSHNKGILLTLLQPNHVDSHARAKKMR
jgi:hypothetical protein